MSPQVPGRRRSPLDLKSTSISRRSVLLSGVALPLGAVATKATATVTAALQSAPSAKTALAAASSSSPQLTLPAPTGRQRLGTVSLHLVDPTRPDPWVPNVPFRELMIQIWYPARDLDDCAFAPYTSTATARAYEASLSQQNGIKLPVLNWPITHARLGAPVQRRGHGWPVVLYSPSLGGERFETTSHVEEIASRGYVVVTIDHVHDCGIVELPDGRLETVAVPEVTVDAPDPVTTKEIEARVADVGFVLDQLALINRGGNPDHERQPLPDGLRGAFDLDRVGMFGQSDGGSTTAHALHTEPRVKVGVDLDGTLWTPQAIAGSDKPLLLFGREQLDPYQATTWTQFQANQRGPALRLNLLGSEHGTFKDDATLVQQVGAILGLPPSVIARAGTIDGLRAIAIVRAYVGAYFDAYLRDQDADLLGGPSPLYPEVVFAQPANTNPPRRFAR